MTWKDAVLQVIRKRRGQEVTLQEIYKGVLVSPVMTDFHDQQWKSGKQLKYQCWVRSTLAVLKKEGLIVHVRKAVYKSN
jgi:hypothetical protein